jgi:hypothetical protein
MSKISLLTQIFMIVIAIVIVFVYIKPTFAKIRTTQETTAAYIAESEKVSDVNLLLKKQVAIVDGVSPADIDALNRYMPDSVDDVVVMKDLLGIFTALKLPLGSIGGGSAGAVVPAEAGAGATITPHSFTLSSQMTYTDLKRLLRALEVNDYLLQIDSLNIAPGAGGLLGIGMTLTTYSRTAATPAVPSDASSGE